MRTTFPIAIEVTPLWKKKLLHYTQEAREVVFFESNEQTHLYSKFDWLVAWDAFTVRQTDTHQAFAELQAYQSQTRDWLFGYLGYDLKNDTEDLHSHNYDGLAFPDLFFFQPKKIIYSQQGQVFAAYLNGWADELESDLAAIEAQTLSPSSAPSIPLQARISEKAYHEKFKELVHYIQQGVIYEVNFCMEFFQEGVILNPQEVFFQLNARSEPPFAVFLKQDVRYLLSASPERYLRKSGTTVISQPIKGTARRGNTPEEDAQLKIDLQRNEKERSENIMIVDLVRNDLSRTAEKGSVAVEALCEVYSFKQVHQMISTIRSTVAEDCSPISLLETTFPMGSMTGAPKIAAMQIIEKVEATKRGIYSGAVGYFTPEGDFDFNVVIRSIAYNAQKGYVSVSVGSAVTAQANANDEYAECLLKAKAMQDVLGGK